MGKMFQVVKLAFDYYDVDNSGTLDPCEMDSLLDDICYTMNFHPMTDDKLGLAMHLLDDNADGVIQFSEFLRNIDQLYATLKRKDNTITEEERNRRAPVKRERKDFNFSEINTIVEMYKRSKKKKSGSDGKRSPGTNKTEIFNRDDNAAKLISITNLVNTPDPPGPTPKVSPYPTSKLIPDAPTTTKPHALYCDTNFQANSPPKPIASTPNPNQPIPQSSPKLPHLQTPWSPKPPNPADPTPKPASHPRGKVFDCLESNFYEGYLKVKP